jgi:predicted HNH restriction endonuclease
VEYLETKQLLRNKFVPKQRMLELQKQLKGKEEILAELTISNRQLVIQCLQLRKGVEATKLYNSVNVDDSTNLHTVVAKAMDHPVEESDIESLLIDESNEDTAREEREAEVMLDCIEKFEEVCTVCIATFIVSCNFV